MLSTTGLVMILVVLLALTFDFINGFHDTATAIATSVSTRSMSPKGAIIMSACLNFFGAFLSAKVAKTVGSGIITPSSVTMMVIIAALLGAILWNLLTWYFGIPSSSSHALIGGLLGAAFVFKWDLNVIHWSAFVHKILIWLVLSPVIGFGVGFLIMILLNWALKPLRPKTVTSVFSKAQIFSAAAVALNHGMNDAQKSMGVITMALVSSGMIAEFNVPIWVKAACALSLAFGTSVGGWRIIKTMGVGMAKLTPVNGFAAQTGAAAVILTASLLEAPVSTTHIITGSIMGVGASKRLSSVRWGLALNILWTWVITIPCCALVAGIVMWVLKLFF